jgi:hypothetical protein
MIDVAHLFDRFAQYGETSRDFLIRVRPPQFARTIRTNSANTYLKPFPFLVVSLVISGVFAFTVAAFILVGTERKMLFHLGILGCIAIIVAIWLVNLVLIAAAKVAAFALGVSASFSDLLDGYCYASVLFPLVIVATEVAALGQAQPSVSSLLVLFVIQLLFLALACVAMTSFVPMHPRYFWRISLGTFLIMVAGSYVAFDIIDDFDRPEGYVVQSPRARLEDSFLAPNDFYDQHCSSVTLIGKHMETDGAEWTVWFEWGETRALGNITVTQRFSRNSSYEQLIAGLKENKTYYYRAVGSSKNGSFKGRVFSFTTARC